MNHGYDFLLLSEDVDEFAMQVLGPINEKAFRNALTEDLELLTDEEKKQNEAKAESEKALIDFVKEALGEKVVNVRLSGDLGRHPVSLTSDNGMSFEMEKYLQKVNPEFAEKAGRILELNPEHAIYKKLSACYVSDPEKAKKYAELLYSQALLIADLPIEDVTAYTDLVCELMA